MGMEFKEKYYQYKDGDMFIKTFFAWFPVKAGFRTRWLEKVTVKYEMHRFFHGKWAMPIEFMDEKK